MNTETIEITGGPDYVGGLSGLVVLPDGSGYTAIGDRNLVVRGQFQRQDGVLTGATVTGVDQMRDWKGRFYVGAWNDAEGLALTADGRLMVSFENQYRVVIFDDALRGTLLPPIPPMGNAAGNAGFEALAIDAQGRPVIIMERPVKLPAYTMVFRLENGDWRRIGNLVRTDRFLATGADFGPDGKLYVLERRIGLNGFRSRIRRVDLLDEGLMTGDIVWASHRAHGNLEGLSVWQAGDGTLRATMVADDNQLSFLPGGFVEITLAKPAGAD